eukprot:g17778.t1
MGTWRVMTCARPSGAWENAEAFRCRTWSDMLGICFSHCVLFVPSGDSMMIDSFFSCTDDHFAFRIIHTDIKPDNLLMSLDKKSVKLSDFGCAIDTQDEVQIKHIRRAYASSYRAPEIILGQSYSTRADMWSAAATLFELADGRVLFAESSNNTMLYDMLKTCGPFKKAFATVGKNSLKHFSIEGDFKRRKTDGNEQLLPMRRFAKPAKPPLLSRLREKLEDAREELRRKHEHI